MKFAFCFLFMASLAAAGPPTVDVNVVGDLTPAGRRALRPSAAQPVYYFPVLKPYQNVGVAYAGERPPPAPATVAHRLGLALARQGYLEATGSHRPGLFLVIYYGSFNPAILTDPGAKLGQGLQPLSGRMDFDEAEMAEMVGGSQALGEIVPWLREIRVPDLHKPRYFVLVTAYDYAAYAGTHQKVVLWQAKMSVLSQRVNFDQVVGDLIDKGAPWFGRAAEPQQFAVPAEPEGHVFVGKPIVRPD